MRYLYLALGTPAVLYSCLAALVVVGVIAVVVIVRLGSRGEGARLSALADSEVGPAILAGGEGAVPDAARPDVSGELDEHPALENVGSAADDAALTEASDAPVDVAGVEEGPANATEVPALVDSIDAVVLSGSPAAGDGRASEGEAESVEDRWVFRV